MDVVLAMIREWLAVRILDGRVDRIGVFDSQKLQSNVVATVAAQATWAVA